MSNSNAVVKLINVSKRYYISESIYVDALINVNLNVYRGEVVIIMGPSGSGKSTLLNIMGMLDKPTSGRVYLDDVDVTDMSENELAKLRLLKVGFLFQQYNLIQNLTALENVMMPMLMSGMYDEAMAEAKARYLLELVELTPYVNHYPNQLSGGQQQRVALARALALNPSLIIMDEPTGALDPVSASKLLALINVLNKTIGVTMVIATHNPDVAQIGSRIINIRGGRVYETGVVERINVSSVNVRDMIRNYVEGLKIDLLARRRSRLADDVGRIEEEISRLEEVIENQRH
ncbi:ABC transporter ATP-binding protein [Caldivirga maquilingensis]|uniref:ABC transporter related n=1 Tax=Caldivirga maquilingensis (strain ATCC 700844 / DSM 13496 / JCM 10307 / IC-167) TaxID=397948 RepID=A8MB60_CALMQ|nr:ABC transporter ATP-binding protein [Caldivirga maquilingensis]ABW01150.1 ABC transporter related [Caldivirga maquilingensis IC-167]